MYSVKKMSTPYVVNITIIKSVSAQIQLNYIYLLELHVSAYRRFTIDL